MYNDYNGYNNAPQNGYGYGYAAQPSLTYNQYLTRTFRWMAFGLLITFGLAYLTAYSSLIYTVVNLYLPLTIAELVLVFVLSARVQHMQVGTARALFLAYAALNGLVMSIYFVIFDVSTLVMAFLSAAVYFGIMAAYGALTSRDLSGWGTKLFGALIALLLCSFVGMLFGMGFFASMLYSGIGLGIFMLLTAYDTQKLQSYYGYYSGSGEMLEKSAVFGALSLYLDFINIFLFVLRLFGSRSSRN
jgi:FtsH-binding integral membrane protein